ncbi:MULTISPECIES: DUF1796 family putative cysteine peptidase [Bacillus]|uniref:Peptidase n=1 Tax=Bacillus glycinifermentans TaxID=1664069 RepID=A0AAJ4D1S8_9BACI|nr:MULTISPECIES: DUF1796 family putative cysteine peptidase [Bacillus]MDU0073184.1 DUF1796 family putative cysteine peptidase [Bacillus sp. IG6]MED8021021.1 DUF1796 family putative cysteine peptidase [Bacillus glycinifermentans]QAT64121.1 peptidase [Bacillus glycinifermentans]WKB78018.1 DUF1796 family putative cysteine peptidase [Bacillus glycinifermentans]SCA84486.1 hypothetical protein BGLY_0663 [Bacillus glycinifermentans]
MNLNQIKGNYNAIFGLGHLCLTGLQLRKNNLRPFAGPLDWVGTPYLSDLTRMLKDRFSHFLEPHNLRVTGYSTGVDTPDRYILVRDDYYCVDSAHDFKADKNTMEDLVTYPEVKAKFKRRINRFLDKMETADRILFVRTSGTFKEAQELEAVLSDLVKNDFSVLLINHTKVNGLVEQNWPLQRVCAVELPDKEIWVTNDHLWRQMFNGIRYVPSQPSVGAGANMNVFQQGNLSSANAFQQGIPSNVNTFQQGNLSNVNTFQQGIPSNVNTFQQGNLSNVNAFQKGNLNK